MVGSYRRGEFLTSGGSHMWRRVKSALSAGGSHYELTTRAGRQCPDNFITIRVKIRDAEHFLLRWSGFYLFASL